MGEWMGVREGGIPLTVVQNVQKKSYKKESFFSLGIQFPI